MAVQQYLSEKVVLEAQLMNVSQDGENPLISSNNEGDARLDVSDEANSIGSLDGAVSVNSEDNEGENPVTEEDNEVPLTSSVVEGEEGEKGEQDGAGKNEEQVVTTEQSAPEDLPPYFSEVHATLLQSTLYICGLSS